MILLVLGVVSIFIICWIIAYFDENMKRGRDVSFIDPSTPIFYSHCLLCGIFLVSSFFYQAATTFLPYSWSNVVVWILIVTLIINCFDELYSSSMMFQLLLNLRQILVSILLLLALTTVWDLPLIWPSLKYLGWTGDFRGILLFIIPIYNITCVANNPLLIRLPVIVFITSLILHFVFWITASNFAIQSGISIWIWIFINNFISFGYALYVNAN